MVKMKVKVKWDDLQFSPYNTNKKGGVYVSYTIGVKDGPGGYFGIQIKANGGQFIFSIWDADRWTKVKNKKVIKKSSKLTWPLDMKRCHRNCQDCGMSDLRDEKKLGYTTGTQCVTKYPMTVGSEFELTLQRIETKRIIKTADFGGMPKSHVTIGEVDREVIGSVWEVKARKLHTRKRIKIGKILFEGDDRGMFRLGTFDEMLGCNVCNQIYHRDTRYDLQIEDGKGNTRRPIMMEGKIKCSASTCKNYRITGSKNKKSITFESGPLTTETCKSDKFQIIWKKG